MNSLQLRFGGVPFHGFKELAFALTLTSLAATPGHAQDSSTSGTGSCTTPEVLLLSNTLVEVGNLLSSTYLPADLSNASGLDLRNSVITSAALALDSLQTGANGLAASTYSQSPLLARSILALQESRDRLEEFGLALYFQDYPASAQGLRNFEAALEDLHLGMELHDRRISNVIGKRVDTGVSALGLLGPSRQTAVALLGEAQALADDSATIQQQLAGMDTLSRAQLELYGLERFNGDQFLATLANADARAALDEVFANADEYVDFAASNLLLFATLEIGQELRNLGEMLIAEDEAFGSNVETEASSSAASTGAGGTPDCPDLCEEDQCTLDEVGVGKGGNAASIKANPDEIEDLEFAFELLMELAESYAGSAGKLKPLAVSKIVKTLIKQAAEGNDGNALTGLMNLMKRINPSFWIKVKYSCCVDEDCRDWYIAWALCIPLPAFTTEERKDYDSEETSDWIEIPPPPGPAGWTGKSQQQILRRLVRKIPAKVAEACEDACES